jgi:hypothetical protein
LLKDVPGTKGAARSWFDFISEVLIAAGMVQSKIDSCVFYFREDGKIGGCMGLHVDDGRLWCHPDRAEQLRKFFEKRDIGLGLFEACGNERRNFNGRFYTVHKATAERGAHVEIDQDEYIKVKLKEIILEGNRDPERDATPGEFKSFESSLGGLTWVVVKSQFQEQVSVSLLAGAKKCLKVKHLLNCNEVIRRIRANPLRPTHFALESLEFSAVKGMSISDASEPSEDVFQFAGITKGQAGRVLGLMTNGAPGEPGRFSRLTERTQRMPRAGHSSFDCETIAAIESLDDVLLLSAMVNEVFYGPIPTRVARFCLAAHLAAYQFRHLPCEIHTDSEALVKVSRGLLQGQLTRRRRTDVADFRENIKLSFLRGLYHICGPTNPADPLTKSGEKVDWDSFYQIMRDGWYVPDFLEKWQKVEN